MGRWTVEQGLNTILVFLFRIPTQRLLCVAPYDIVAFGPLICRTKMAAGESLHNQCSRLHHLLMNHGK